MPPVVPSWAKVAMCSAPCAPSMAPTVSVACGCRCTAAGSSALPVGPGAIWTRRVRSGVRSSSARQPCSGLQPAGSASHTAASRHRSFPGSQPPQPGKLLQIHQHRVRLLQLARPGSAARRVPGGPAGEPWRSLPAAARYFPGPGAAARCGLCGAGHLAACLTGVARWPCGLPAHDAGWKRGQPLRACCWHCRASA